MEQVLCRVCGGELVRRVDGQWGHRAGEPGHPVLPYDEGHAVGTFDFARAPDTLRAVHDAMRHEYGADFWSDKLPNVSDEARTSDEDLGWDG